MTYEISKCANGYVVRPTFHDNRYGNAVDVRRIYVFETYRAMVGKLQELLAEESKDADLLP